jgi:hypothetical protein
MLLIALTVSACAGHAAAQAVKSLLPAEAAAASRLSEGAGDYARMSTTAVPGQAFKIALRVEVTKKPQRAQQVTVSTPVAAAIAHGDVWMVSF